MSVLPREKSKVINGEVVCFRCERRTRVSYDGHALRMRPDRIVVGEVRGGGYRKQPVEISTQLLDEACETYFLDKPLNGTQAAV